MGSGISEIPAPAYDGGDAPGRRQCARPQPPPAGRFRQDARFEQAPSRSHQAARTDSRNLATSTLRRLLSPDSDCAAERTCDEAVSVSVAPRCTSVMLAEIC